MNIFDIDFWKEIGQTISRNRNRSIMTSLGVFWGVLLLIILVGFSVGLKGIMSETIGGVPANSAFFFGSPTSIPYKGMQAGRSWNMDNDLFNAIKDVDRVKHVIPFYSPKSSKLILNASSVTGYVIGKDIKDPIVTPIKMLKGRYFNKMDFEESRKVCVLGEQIEEELFKGENPIGEKLIINNSLFTVIGVSSISRGISFYHHARTAAIPSPIYNKVYNNLYYDGIAIVADDDANITDVEKSIEGVIRSVKTIAPDDRSAIWSMNLKDRLDGITMFILGINALTWIVGLGTLFAAIVGVSNIMLVVVRERTQEIGVRRAIGAKPSNILIQILTESFCLTFVAGILGFATGVGILALANDAVIESMSNGDSVSTSIQISFWLGLGLTGIIIVGSLLAGLLPASRALKIKAVDALREE